MANVIQRNIVLAGSKLAIVQFNLTAVDAQETDTLVYDSSVVATAAGVTDSLNSTILEVLYSTSCSAAATVARLEFDATTDIPALAIPLNNAGCLNFKPQGGLVNLAGTGKTGDITLTTLGLIAGDSITIQITVRRD